MSTECEPKVSKIHEQLRDCFAMSALNGILGNPNVTTGQDPKYWAKLAYRYADEMLTARRKKYAD